MRDKLFLKIILEIWDILADASVYILIGLFLSGILYVFFRHEKVIKYLGSGKIKSVFWAALIGMPLPLCSCAVIPTAITLRKQGADKGAVSSFLISTPETSIDSIILSYVLLDPILVIFRPVSALITAVFAGIMEIIFGSKDNKKNDINNEKSYNGCNLTNKQDHSIFHKFKAALNYGFVELMGDIALWLFLGVVVASVISVLVPATLFNKYFSNNFQSMFIMLAIGIPTYICASASTPIAASLIFKGINPGAALVFLLTGPATNITSLILLLKYFGKRSVFIYLLSISFVAIMMGAILDFIYVTLKIDPQASVGNVRELFPIQMKWFFAFVLICIMINALCRKNKCNNNYGR